jgi:SAM-dependent methyltransferase
MLSTYSEIPVTQATCGAIALLLLAAHRSWSWSDQGRMERSWKSLGLTRALAFTLPLLSIGAAYQLDRPGIVSWDRNFFGVVRVEDENGVRTLAHGSTSHGKQRHAPFQLEPTEYYARQSGVVKAIIAAGTKGSLKMGVVGLGCGVLAAYGREGDHFDFIEINPAVIEIAKQKFSFIRDTSATVSLHLGDGRLVLERMEPRQYDILAIDAFSSDAIPAHLLTLEAIALYKKMLAPGGMLAIHVSNNHLDLAPLVHRLANENGLESRLVISRARPKDHVKAALWVLACEPGNPLWDAPELWEATPPTPSERDRAPRWTDQSHDLFSVMRVW